MKGGRIICYYGFDVKMEENTDNIKITTNYKANVLITTLNKDMYINACVLRGVVVNTLVL